MSLSGLQHLQTIGSKKFRLQAVSISEVDNPGGRGGGLTECDILKDIIWKFSHTIGKHVYNVYDICLAHNLEYNACI